MRFAALRLLLLLLLPAVGPSEGMPEPWCEEPELVAEVLNSLEIVRGTERAGEVLELLRRHRPVALEAAT